MRSSPERRPVLLVVVDTEEEFDWTGPFARQNTAVTHMRALGRFQALCDEFGVRPVYVCDYPIATQEESAAPLREIHASGRCEVGVHLHPWVTPPFEEELSRFHSYPGNLPRALEQAKLREAGAAVERAFGMRPRVYKAGRYGLGANSAALLEEQGFEVDLSPCPPFDLGDDGGPDYSAFPSEPFRLGPSRRVLSIPATGSYVGFVKDGAHGLYRLATAPALRWARLPGILARLRAIDRLFLSPEGYAHADHRRLTQALLEREQRVFSFTLHSPSLVPGHTPYVRSAADLERFLDTIRRYFAYFLGELAGTSMTATEIKTSLDSDSQKASA